MRLTWTCLYEKKRVFATSRPRSGVARPRRRQRHLPVAARTQRGRGEPSSEPSTSQSESAHRARAAWSPPRPSQSRELGRRRRPSSDGAVASRGPDGPRHDRAQLGDGAPRRRASRSRRRGSRRRTCRKRCRCREANCKKQVAQRAARRDRQMGTRRSIWRNFGGGAARTRGRAWRRRELEHQ